MSSATVPALHPEIINSSELLYYLIFAHRNYMKICDVFFLIWGWVDYCLCNFLFLLIKVTEIVFNLFLSI